MISLNLAILSLNWLEILLIRELTKAVRHLAKFSVVRLMIYSVPFLSTIMLGSAVVSSTWFKVIKTDNSYMNN